MHFKCAYPKVRVQAANRVLNAAMLPGYTVSAVLRRRSNPSLLRHFRFGVCADGVHPKWGSRRRKCEIHTNYLGFRVLAPWSNRMPIRCSGRGANHGANRSFRCYIGCYNPIAKASKPCVPRCVPPFPKAPKPWKPKWKPVCAARHLRCAGADLSAKKFVRKLQRAYPLTLRHVRLSAD